MKKKEKWMAKPNMNDNIGLALFDSKQKAVKWLRCQTGHYLFEKDWVMLGKLWKVKD